MFGYLHDLMESRCLENILEPASSGIYSETKSCRKDNFSQFC